MKFAQIAFASLGLVGLGGCSEGEDLTAEQLSSVVTAAEARLQECYQASLDRTPATAPAPIKVQAVLHVEESGKVGAVELSLPADVELQACVSAVLSSLQFPKAEVPTHASLPLVFSAEADAAAP